MKAVSIWSLNCPAGYTGLGHVATIEYNMTMPGDVYCMKSDFVAPVETADWTPAYSHRFRFTDTLSGKTVERWNIINKSIRNDECQNLFTFTAASRDYYQGGTDTNGPYFEQLDKNHCLTKNMANYRTEKPVNNIYMTDVEYDFENVDKETKPSVVHLTTMFNEGDFPQIATRTINTATSRSMSYHTAESTSVTGSFGVTLPINPAAGVSMTVTFTPSFTTTFEIKDGETITKTEADAIAMTAFVPERSKIPISITANEYTVALPYTAWLEKIYYDGTSARKFTKGIFDGVDMKEYMIQYGKIESLDGRITDDDSTGSNALAPIRPSKRKSDFKLYYGESSVAELKIIGEPFTSNSLRHKDTKNMFDHDSETAYMTSRVSPTTPQGFELDFRKEVEIAEIYILPDPNEEDGYRHMCLFTDERESALFCSDHDYIHRKDQNLLDRKIHFVAQFKKTYFRMTTRRMKLVWTCSGCYGRIRDLEIAYRELLIDSPTIEAKNEHEQALANLQFFYWNNMNVQEEGSDRDIYPFDSKNQGQVVSSFAECAQNCFNEDACMVWTFMSQTGKCWIRTTWPITIDGNNNDHGLFTSNMVYMAPISGHRGTYISHTTPLRKETGILKLKNKMPKTPNIVYKWNRGYEIVWESNKDFTDDQDSILYLTNRGRRSTNRTQRATDENDFDPSKISINYASVNQDNYLSNPTSYGGKVQDLQINFYRPRNYEDEYCVLGDSVGVNSYSQKFLDSSKPSRFNLLLHDETAPPQRAHGSYLKKPQDAKILHRFDKFEQTVLEIYEFEPPPGGFTCLGQAVSTGGKPDLSRYCCVKDEFLIDGNSYVTTNLKVGSDRRVLNF